MMNEFCGSVVANAFWLKNEITVYEMKNRKKYGGISRNLPLKIITMYVYCSSKISIVSIPGLCTRSSNSLSLTE